MFHYTCLISCFEKQNQNKHVYAILKNISLSSSKKLTKVHRLAHCFIYKHCLLLSLRMCNINVKVTVK